MRNMTNAVVHSCLHCHAGSWQAEASPRSLARTARSRPRSSRSAKPCGILLQHYSGFRVAAAAWQDRKHPKP